MAKAKNEWGGHALYKQVRAKVGDWQQSEKDMLAIYERANQADAALLNSASDTSSVPSSALPKANGSPEAVYPETSSPSDTTLTGSPSTMKNRGNVGSDINDSLSGNGILKDQPPVKNISDATRPAGFAESLSQTTTPESVYSDLLQISTKPNPQTFAQASQDIVANEQAITSGNTRQLKQGDTNNDNLVNILDLSTLLSKWGTNNTACDFNHNGTVDLIDLSILLSHYGT